MAFSSLICEVKELNTKTVRTLIYRQTWKQCSVLFRVFEVYLGKHMYHSDVSPKSWIVEMYHAVTPASKSMASDDGHVHVLTSTVAFVMGVNCKKVILPPSTVAIKIQSARFFGGRELSFTLYLSTYKSLPNSNLRES